MIGIEFSFLTGRYQGPPRIGGRNGGAEWPPSPWWIVRSLIGPVLGTAACRSTLARIVSALSEPPVFCLPEVEPGYDRCRPDGGLRIVMREYVMMRPGAKMVVRWDDAMLLRADLPFFRRLVDTVRHIGFRANRVKARLVDGATPQPTCVPAAAAESEGTIGIGSEEVTLLAPMSAAEYSSWRSGVVEWEMAAQRRIEEWRRCVGGTASSVASEGRQRQQAELTVPRDVLGCLAERRGAPRLFEGYLPPPGARTIRYVIRS